MEEEGGVKEILNNNMEKATFCNMFLHFTTVSNNRLQFHCKIYINFVLLRLFEMYALFV